MKDTFKTNISSKQYQSLLIAVVRRLFHHDKVELSPYQIAEAILLKSKENELEKITDFQSIVSVLEKTLIKAVHEKWTPESLELFLSKTDIEEGHLKVFSAFWKSEAIHIYNAITKGSTTNSKLGGVRWKINKLAGSSSTQSQIHTSAVLELSIINKEKTRKVTLGMSKKEIEDLLVDFKKIKQHLENASY